MPKLAPPSVKNQYHAQHIARLLESYYQLTGEHLIKPTGDITKLAKQAYEAPCFIASHGLESDPVLNYGNRYALKLFAMNWENFTRTPSRYTAEAPNRAERKRLLNSVTEKGFIDDYSGIRISADGKRFRIHQATVWNVFDTNGQRIGQAATFSNWKNIDSD